jgi:hypothetical protein
MTAGVRAALGGAGSARRGSNQAHGQEAGVRQGGAPGLTVEIEGGAGAAEQIALGVLG